MIDDPKKPEDEDIDEFSEFEDFDDLDDELEDEIFSADDISENEPFEEFDDDWDNDSSDDAEFMEDDTNARSERTFLQKYFYIIVGFIVLLFAGLVLSGPLLSGSKSVPEPIQEPLPQEPIKQDTVSPEAIPTESETTDIIDNKIIDSIENAVNEIPETIEDTTQEIINIDTDAVPILTPMPGEIETVKIEEPNTQPSFDEIEGISLARGHNHCSRNTRYSHSGA